MVPNITISKKTAIFLLRLYRHTVGYSKALAPLLPTSCRFYPTCSEFAEEAVRTHGLLQGIHMTLRRVVRCHPFARGGYDPVP